MFLKSILIILCFSSYFSRCIKALRYINRRERAFVRGISGVLLCFAFLFLHVCVWQSGIWLMILFYTYHLCPSCLLQLYAQWPGRLICACGTDWFSRAWLGRGMGRIRRGQQSLCPFVPLLSAIVPSSSAARLAEAVFLCFSLSHRGMSVASCSRSWVPHHPLVVP